MRSAYVVVLVGDRVVSAWSPVSPRVGAGDHRRPREGRVGRGAAWRHGRSGQPGADRESPHRRHGRSGPVPDRGPVRPGDYTVTFTLARLRHREARGAPGQRLDGHRRGRRDARRRRAGDDHCHRRDAGGRRAEHQARDHARQRDAAEPAERAQLQLSADAVPGVQTNGNNVNTGPMFAIFPIHGGRGVESRLTVDGLNISNPPGGNQPPNFTADIGNAQEVTMITSGGLGEMETAGLTMNIVPKQGGNSFSGLAFVSGFSKGMQADNFTAELQGARRHAADAGVPRLRRQHRRPAGRSCRTSSGTTSASACRDRGRTRRTCSTTRTPATRAALIYDAGSDPAGVLRSHVGELHAAHHLAGVAAQQDHRLVGRAAGLPQVHRARPR